MAQFVDQQVGQPVPVEAGVFGVGGEFRLLEPLEGDVDGG